MTQYADWLDVKGCQPLVSDQFDSTRRYIRNGRDRPSGHIDVLFQAYFYAADPAPASDPSDTVTGEDRVLCPTIPTAVSTT
jgi:hypothetical protein